MDPSTEKNIWRSRTADKTKSRICSEQRLRYLPRSDVTNHKVQLIGQNAKLARERFSDKFGDMAWDYSRTASGSVDKRHEEIQQYRRRSENDLVALDEEIGRAWEGVSKGTGAQKIACLRKLEDSYDRQHEIKSTLESIAFMASDPTSEIREAEVSSLRATHLRETMPQAARSVSHSPAITSHRTHHEDKARNCSHPGLSFPRLDSNVDVAPASVAKVKNKSALPVWPPRSRGSYSENSFLSKRTKDGENSNLKGRIISEPISRKIYHSRHGVVGAGSRNRARTPWGKFTLAALRKASSSKNENMGTQSVYPLQRKSSKVKKGNPTIDTRAKSVNQHPGPRPSQRLSQKRNRADSLPRADGPLKNHLRKRKRSNELGLMEERPSWRLRLRLRNTTGINKQSLPNGGKSASLPRGRRTADEGTGVAKKKLTVNIPADTNMATDLRSYSQWPDDSGALVNAQGCLLPANYDFSGVPDFEWICPVRSCRSCFQNQKKLGAHFSSHRSCLFNDNCDGTFTIVGNYTKSRNGNGNRRPALVKSKIPLPKHAPPLMEPRPPASWVTTAQQEPFLASQKKARSLTAPVSREVKTVDEMMLHKGFLGLSSVETSGASELGEPSRTSSLQDVEPRSSKKAASATRLNSLDDAESEEEGTPSSPVVDQNRHENASNEPRDATKENWRQMRKFLTGRQFYPPKTGRGPFAALLSSPRTRDIVLRPGLTFVADQPKKVRLLIVHMTGKEPPVPCNSCAEARGPFKKCVAISKAAAGETTNGIVCCTNCASERRLQQNCNVEDLLSQPGAVQQRKQRKQRLAAESGEQSSTDNVSSRATKVDSRFTFAVQKLPVDGSLDLGAELLSIRLCSVAAGKVMVELEGNRPFLIGPHGMFKLMPGMSAQISNACEAEAVLHVSVLKT